MLTAIIAGITTLILTIIGIPAFIRFYQKARISGQQMHEDVKQHQAKAGTPTMGGTVFLLASIVYPLAGEKAMKCHAYPLQSGILSQKVHHYKLLQLQTGTEGPTFYSGFI